MSVVFFYSAFFLQAVQLSLSKYGKKQLLQQSRKEHTEDDDHYCRDDIRQEIKEFRCHIPQRFRYAGNFQMIQRSRQEQQEHNSECDVAQDARDGLFCFRHFRSFIRVCFSRHEFFHDLSYYSSCDSSCDKSDYQKDHGFDGC